MLKGQNNVETGIFSRGYMKNSDILSVDKSTVDFELGLSGNSVEISFSEDF